jgi:hypothetical protein
LTAPEQNVTVHAAEPSGEVEDTCTTGFPKQITLPSLNKTQLLVIWAENFGKYDDQVDSTTQALNDMATDNTADLGRRQINSP